jgi:catalase (peroxidase I)
MGVRPPSRACAWPAAGASALRVARRMLGLRGGSGEGMARVFPCATWPHNISAFGPGARRARRRLSALERLDAAVNATLTAICSKILN